MKIDFSEFGKTLLHGLGDKVAVGWIEEENLEPLTVTYRGKEVKYDRIPFARLTLGTFESLDHGFITFVKGILLGWSNEYDAEAFVPLKYIYWFMGLIEKLTDLRTFEENLEFFLPEEPDYPLIVAYPGIRGYYLMFAVPHYPPEVEEND